MIKVMSEVTIYQQNGKDTIVERPVVQVKSHWNKPDFVDIKINDVEVTVLARDLKSAIDNATNTNR